MGRDLSRNIGGSDAGDRYPLCAWPIGPPDGLERLGRWHRFYRSIRSSSSWSRRSKPSGSALDRALRKFNRTARSSPSAAPFPLALSRPAIRMIDSSDRRRTLLSLESVSLHNLRATASGSAMSRIAVRSRDLWLLMVSIEASYRCRPTPSLAWDADHVGGDSTHSPPHLPAAQSHSIERIHIYTHSLFPPLFPLFPLPFLYIR